MTASTVSLDGGCHSYHLQYHDILVYTITRIRRKGSPAAADQEEGLVCFRQQSKCLRISNQSKNHSFAQDGSNREVLCEVPVEWAVRITIMVRTKKIRHRPEFGLNLGPKLDLVELLVHNFCLTARDRGALRQLVAV